MRFGEKDTSSTIDDKNVQTSPALQRALVPFQIPWNWTAVNSQWHREESTYNQLLQSVASQPSPAQLELSRLRNSRDLMSLILGFGGKIRVDGWLKTASEGGSSPCTATYEGLGFAASRAVFTLAKYCNRMESSPNRNGRLKPVRRG